MQFKTSPKKPVNKFIAWACSFGYFIGVVLILLLIFQGSVVRLIKCITDKMNFGILNSTDVICFSVLTLVVIFLLFCLNFFEWFFNPTLTRTDNYLVFKSDDVIAALGRATTTYTIKSIDSYKECKTSIIIKGNISVKEPLSRGRDTTKCEIPCLYDKDDKEKVLEMVKEFCNAKK